ncbi:LysR substrate-binding domain-containing protein [Neotabrizicola sp. VNH66]|uniref:LysR substrate-binding domain-containing protein n=1 Tax=Neotabrizicola sp. VNH66 TaxID=3400918 RepID=UPI003C11A0D9
MDVRQIEAFHAVMTWGTTARAAEVLRISQPAVSKAIMALERAVGFRIFDREKGRLVPTAEGQLFYREVEISFAGIARLRSAAARIRDYGTGEVRLGCLSAFSTNLVPYAIARFRRSHPEVSVTLVVAGSSVLRDQVAANHLDLAVTADEIVQTGVDATPFAEIDAMIALPPGHPLSSREEILPADLDGQPFVALAAEDTTRHEAEQIFASHGVAPRVAVETAYSSTVCALVLSGLGCGIVDPLTAPGFLERGMILRPMRPTVRFRTLLLMPPKKPSLLAVEMAKSLSVARAELTGG